MVYPNICQRVVTDRSRRIFFALFAFLFLYTATSKILDFPTFKVQIGQSPMIAAHANYLAYLVPVLEFVLGIWLLLDLRRFTALLLSGMLMTAFATYIILLLKYSPYLPCSCGGVLEQLGWTDHLYLNLLFVVVGWMILFQISPFSNSLTTLVIVSSTAVSVFTVVMLHLVSDHTIRYGNNGNRIITPHGVELDKVIDLKFNSYYFAGTSEGNIYLGNSTAPLLMTILDTCGMVPDTVRISLREKDEKYIQPLVKVDNGTFIFYEGQRPYIYRGSTMNWNATKYNGNIPYFSQAVLGGKDSVLLRGLESKTGKHLITVVGIRHKNLRSYPSFLPESADGIFDNDGVLHYDDHLRKALYVYRYKGIYSLADLKTGKSFDRTTLDTLRKPILHLKRAGKDSIRTFSRPPTTVNRLSAVQNGMLFCNSKLLGKHDSEELFKNASIIDRYKLHDGSYLSSIVLHDYKHHKVDQFIVYGNSLYSISDRYLIRYKLMNHLQQ